MEHGVESKAEVEVFEVSGGDCDGNEDPGRCEDDGEDSIVWVAACLEGRGSVRR